MSLLAYVGIALAVPVGLAIAIGLRDRRSGCVNDKRIDADKARSATTSFVPGGRHFGEYLPPPDDGRPPH